MRRTLLLFTMVGAMLLALNGVVLAQQDRTTSNGSAQRSAGNPGEAIPGKYIVVLRDDVDPAAVARQHSQRYGARVTHVYRHAIKGYAAELPEQAVDGVSRNPRVQFVSEDRVVEALAQETPTGINRVEADLSSTAKIDGVDEGVNVAVAVIDTGSGPHTDLNVVGGKNCSTGKSYNDGNGHGTHVAGTVAAKDNGTGVVGVAPGAPIYSVRVLNNAGSGSISSVVCGIDWVTANAGSKNIKVANMSLGGSGSDDGNCGNTNNDAEHRAICGSVAKGVTYVVAAGNSGTDFKGSVPAAYNEVLTVTAVADFNGRPGGGATATCRSDVDETAADFSNFTTMGHADEDHTIAAPGVCIRSTWKDGGYNTISGTSMASPHAAGAAALYKANNPTATPAQVMTKLRSDAATKTGNDSSVSGYYGFTDDPNTPNGGRYYGYLEYAGGY